MVRLWSAVDCGHSVLSLVYFGWVFDVASVGMFGLVSCFVRMVVFIFLWVVRFSWVYDVRVRCWWCSEGLESACGVLGVWLSVQNVVVLRVAICDVGYCDFVGNLVFEMVFIGLGIVVVFMVGC